MLKLRKHSFLLITANCLIINAFLKQVIQVRSNVTKSISSIKYTCFNSLHLTLIYRQYLTCEKRNALLFTNFIYIRYSILFKKKNFSTKRGYI